MDTRRPQQSTTASSKPQSGPTQNTQARGSSAQQRPGAKSGAGPGRGNDAPLQPDNGNPAETAREFAAEASTAAASLANDFRKTAKSAARAVQEQASELAADVGHELSQTAEQQKVRGVEAMQGFARAIGSAAEELEDQSPQVANYVRDAAAKIDDLSSNLRGRSVPELMQAASGLARSQPALFFAGAMAAGFALSRFLKSSAPEAGSVASTSAAGSARPGTSAASPLTGGRHGNA